MDLPRGVLRQRSKSWDGSCRWESVSGDHGVEEDSWCDNEDAESLPTTARSVVESESEEFDEDIGVGVQQEAAHAWQASISVLPPNAEPSGFWANGTWFCVSGHTP